MVFGIFYQEFERFDSKSRSFTGEKYMDEAVGSDAYFTLDGRNRMPTWQQDMRQQARKLRKIHPHYVAFKIMRGSILHANAISDLIYLNTV